MKKPWRFKWQWWRSLNDNQFYLRIRCRNGEKIQFGEGYLRKGKALRIAKAVAPDWQIEEIKPE